MTLLRTAILLLPTGLFSCVPVGPDYAKPDLPQASRFAGAANETAAPDLDAWWQRLGSTELDRLVDAALSRNLDLAIAGQRLREARSLRKEAASAFLPQAGSNLSATRYHFDDDLLDSFGDAGLTEPSGFFGSPLEFWSSGLDVSWEIDVFGGRLREMRAATAREEATQEALYGIRLAVATEVVDAYLSLAGLREQLDTVEDQIRLQSSQKQETQERVAAGALGRTDLDRAQSRLETTRIQKPPLEAGIVSQLRRLTLLLGQPSSSLDGRDVAADGLPSRLPMTRTGLPAELLLRRPDLRQAEREMAAATEDLGVALSNFYPRFTIGAGLSGFGTSAGDLFDASNYLLQYGPKVEWSLFSGGRHRAALERADAKQRAAFLAYEKAVLKAVGEVETELANLRAESQRLAGVQRARAATTTAVRRVRENYQAGALAQTEVLIEEEQLREIEIAEIRIKSQMLQVWIRLHKALGGGWRAE